MSKRPKLLQKLPEPPAGFRKYSTKGIIPSQGKKKKIWRAGPVLNQGQTGHCFGFGWAAEYLAAPHGDFDIPASKGNELGHLLYEWQVKFGSSGQAGGIYGSALGAEFGKRFGYLTEYRWPDNLKELRDAVIAEGPVVLSTAWLESMSWTTRIGGMLKVNRSQPFDSFHMYAIVGYDPNKPIRNWRGKVKKLVPAFLIRNSWGANWGVKGNAWITEDDLDYLLRQGGSLGYEGRACVPMGRKPIDVTQMIATLRDELS